MVPRSGQVAIAQSVGSVDHLAKARKRWPNGAANLCQPVPPPRILAKWSAGQTMSARAKGYLADGERAGSRYVLGVPRRLARGAGGMHQGGRAGSSVEFKEHRGYQPGDDLRHIDWNAYARSDQLTVKLFHEEVNPRLDVVLDGSRSMALPDGAKAGAALGLAALFTSAAANGGFRHGVWLTRAGCRPPAGGARRASHADEG